MRQDSKVPSARKMQNKSYSAPLSPPSSPPPIFNATDHPPFRQSNLVLVGGRAVAGRNELRSGECVQRHITGQCVSQREVAKRRQGGVFVLGAVRMVVTVSNYGPVELL